VPIVNSLLNDAVKVSLIDSADTAGSGLLSWRRFAAKLQPLCIAERAALIHDHGAWAGSNHAAAWVARKLRLPLVSSPRGMLLAWSMNHRRYRKRLAMLLYQRRDLQSVAFFIVTSAEEGEDLRRMGLRQPIAVIPNGVSTAPVPPASKHTKRGTEHIALFLSRLHPKKGVHDLITAWAALRPKDWTLWIAGPDEDGYRGRLETMIRDFALGDTCIFLGAVAEEDKWQTYRSADLFVLPTYSENFAITVAEALLCGLPVITTTGAPWRALVDERCGWWVEPGPAALEGALREATSLSDDERGVLGARGKQYVLDTFSWDTVARNTTLCYDWWLGRGDKPSCVIG
jgi:glycosyltransferase involved in cell wall biosynthesis